MTSEVSWCQTTFTMTGVKLRLYLGVLVLTKAVDCCRSCISNGRSFLIVTHHGNYSSLFKIVIVLTPFQDTTLHWTNGFVDVLHGLISDLVHLECMHSLHVVFPLCFSTEIISLLRNKGVFASRRLILHPGGNSLTPDHTVCLLLPLSVCVCVDGLFRGIRSTLKTFLKRICQ